MSLDVFMPVTGVYALLRIFPFSYMPLLSLFMLRFLCFVAAISSKCCTSYTHYLPLSSFFKDLLTDFADLTARVYAICIPCRTKPMLVRRNGPRYGRLIRISNLTSSSP